MSNVTARAPTSSANARIEWRASLVSNASSLADALAGHSPITGWLSQ
ncbi:MAG: hypothetical protein VW891_06350 [Novosphingobium sp.]